MSSVGGVLFVLISRAFLQAIIPSLCGVLVYKDVISIMFRSLIKRCHYQMSERLLKSPPWPSG